MWQFRRPSRIMTGDETLLLVRDGAVQYVNGLPEPASIQDPIPILCNVQPLGDKDLMLLPEGERTEEQFWLYVPPGQSVVPEVNDKIIRPPALYQIQAVRDWETFQKVRIKRIDTGVYGDDTEPYVAAT